MAKQLRKPVKHIGYAGLKDKEAVTEQFVSIYKGTQRQIEKLDLKDIELVFKGYADERINLGSHEGNHFVITVRNLTNEKINKKPIPNYFDEQRFSTDNVTIGRAIVKKDFKKAIELILVDERDYKQAIEDWLEKMR